MVTQENSSERLCWPNLFNLLHDGSWWFMMVGNGIIKSILSLTNKYNPAGETERCWQGCHQSHLGSCSGFWNIFFWCGATCQIFLCDRWWGGEVVPTRPDHLPGLGGTWHPFLCSDIIITSSAIQNRKLLTVRCETMFIFIFWPYFVPANLALIRLLSDL